MNLSKIAASAALAICLTAGAPAFAGTCQDDLQKTSANWDAAGFPAPAKPMAYQVIGAHGAAISGPDYRRVSSDIRAASLACERGDEASAGAHLLAANTALGGYSWGTTVPGAQLATRPTVPQNGN